MKKRIISCCVLALLVCLAVNPAFAACSHKWGSWRQVGIYHRRGNLPDKCLILVEERQRTCSLCGQIQEMELETQLYHVWQKVDAYTSVCARCGSELVSTR